MTDDERAEILVTARLLRSASVLLWLAAALVVVAAVAMIFVHRSLFAIVSIVAGVVAIYYGVRVLFDARLFEDIASERLTTATLDAALGRSGSDRPWSDRCRGAKRLALKLAIATVAATVALVANAWW